MKKLSLPKRKKILHNDEFKAVLSCHRKSYEDGLTLYVAENNVGHPRLGISVGKASGNAVTRNRLKRLIREVFRQNQHQIPQNLDYVIIIPSKQKSDKIKYKNELLKEITFEKIQSSFLRLIETIVSKKC